MKIGSSLKLASLAAVATLTLGQFASAKVATGTHVGDLQVTDSFGAVHDLSDFAGKNVVLEWTNHGCPYVKKHYKSNNMQALQKEATADGDTVWLSIISSAPGTQGYVSAQKANELTATRGAAPTSVVLDAAGIAGRKFSAKTTPHMYVINADQNLVYQGAIDDNRSADPADALGARNYVREALTAVKSGEAVTTAETSPYGCGVKYAR